MRLAIAWTKPSKVFLACCSSARPLVQRGNEPALSCAFLSARWMAAAAVTTPSSAGGTFLPGLTQAFSEVDAENPVKTADFARACQAILPIFDHLGTVFGFAKGELEGKRKSLQDVQDKYVTLHDLVDADKQAGTVTKKNSCSRNLFRLCHGVLFISELLKYMYKDQQMTLKTACGEAYTNTLASAHSYMVKTAVRTSMYMLPTREHFLKSIHETESSAEESASKFIPTSEHLVKKVMMLFEGTSMPVSDTKWLPAS